MDMLQRHSSQLAAKKPMSIHKWSPFALSGCFVADRFGIVELGRLEVAFMKDETMPNERTFAMVSSQILNHSQIGIKPFNLCFGGTALFDCMGNNAQKSTIENCIVSFH